jgi:hypothetical protein
VFARNFSRVLTVLDAGGEGQLHLSDLSLKTHYSLSNCATHAITMTSLAITELAATHPATAFMHSYPGAVNTGITRNMHPVLRSVVGGLYATVFRAWTVPLEESGERHLFAATNTLYYPPAAAASTETENESSSNSTTPATGADGKPGSGAYLLHWDGSTATKTAKLLQEYRSAGVGKRVWEHTLEVFEKICGSQDGKY